jgi:hypothetical protein
MRTRARKFRWEVRAPVVAFLVLILVPLVAAAPVRARLEVSHTNSFHVTRAGIFRANFLMPKWVETEQFLVAIAGPKRVSHCTLRSRGTTHPARTINGTWIYFWWPAKGLKSATRTTAICRHLTGGQVTAATVFLPIGRHESRITLRHR